MQNHVKVMPLLVLSIITPACVSTSKYKMLEGDRNNLQKQLNSETLKSKDLEEELARTKESNEILQKQGEATKGQYENLLSQLQQEVQQGELQITQYKNMLSVDVAEQIFFDSGSAKLKATGKKVLKKVGDVLNQYSDKMIRVVGHTDNVPVGKAFQNVFPTNWELSVARSTNVVRFLQDESKIDPTRLITSGRGEYSPVAPNDTPEGRKKNRRIEITLIDRSLVDAIKEKSE